MQLSQEDANRILIRAGWWTLIASALGMVACLALWAVGIISHVVMDVVTNVLSWVAIVGTAAQILVTAYTKRDVDGS